MFQYAPHNYALNRPIQSNWSLCRGTCRFRNACSTWKSFGSVSALLNTLASSQHLPFREPRLRNSKVGIIGELKIKSVAIRSRLFHYVGKKQLYTIIYNSLLSFCFNFPYNLYNFVVKIYFIPDYAPGMYAACWCGQILISSRMW